MKVGLFINQRNDYFHSVNTYFFFDSVSASPSILVRLVSRLAIHAGNCTAWSMGFNQMGKCLLTEPLEEEMIPTPPSLVRLVPENTSQELFLWTWNLW